MCLVLKNKLGAIWCKTTQFYSFTLVDMNIRKVFSDAKIWHFTELGPEIIQI